MGGSHTAKSSSQPPKTRSSAPDPNGIQLSSIDTALGKILPVQKDDIEPLLMGGQIYGLQPSHLGLGSCQTSHVKQDQAKSVSTGCETSKVLQGAARVTQSQAPSWH